MNTIIHFLAWPFSPSLVLLIGTIGFICAILVTAYKDTRPKPIDHHRYTPEPTTVTVSDARLYDWTNPVEQMDYDVLMFDCPADPYANVIPFYVETGEYWEGYPIMTVNPLHPEGC